MQGDIKGRITLSKSMRDLLQRLGHWQVTYDHLLLTWAIEVEYNIPQELDREIR